MLEEVADLPLVTAQYHVTQNCPITQVYIQLHVKFFCSCALFIHTEESRINTTRQLQSF